MQFPWKVLGHQKILEKLENDFLSGRLAQSYLFCGPDEIGKFRIAKAFALLLQCEEKNMCRNCAECVRGEKNISMGTFVLDRLWIQGKNEDLEELAKYSNFDQSHRKKSEKKSDQIGIEDIQIFTAPLWQTTSASYKIALIRNAERMTEEAMNSLLKILEEPSEKTIFLLTTTHREKLLPTIVSRTRSIEFGLVPNSVLRGAFSESGMNSLSDEQKEKILTLSQGRSERFLRFLEDSEFLREEENMFLEISRLMKERDVSKLLSAAQNLSSGEESIQIGTYLDALLHFLRTLLREQASETPLSIGSEYSTQDILRLLDRTEETRFLLERNGNKRMLLEMLFLSFSPSER